MATVKGTNKADKITVNASEVIVVTGKKGKPSAISKSGKNTINGAAGKDTITVSSGKSNYIYGGKGSDTFVISKKSTGTAIVKDFSNKEIVQIAGGAVKNIKVSGKNMIIYGGKSGKASLTLANAKGKTFTVKDSSNIYAVTKGVVGVTLKKDFTGTFKAPAFVTTIDAKKVERNGAIIKGNDKANTIKLINPAGGWHEIYGGAGKDTITVTGRSLDDRYGVYVIDGGAGNDLIRVTKATDNMSGKEEIRGGLGVDTITATDCYWIDIYGGSDKDSITIVRGWQNNVYGDAGNDVITVKGDDRKNVTDIDGGTGHDIITVERVEVSNIYGGDDNDTISVKAGVKVQKIEGGKGNDVIKSSGYVDQIFGGAGNDTIYLYDGSSGNRSWPWIDGQEGDDTFNITAGSHYVVDSTGNNTFNITGGSSHLIEGGSDKDTINLNAGSGHDIRGGAGVDTIYINAGEGHKIESGAGADNIIVDMAKSLGSFEIKTVAGDTADKLTFNNAKFEDFDFRYDGNFMIMSYNGCDIKLDYWDNYKPFSKGEIKFGNTSKTYDQISAAAKNL